MEKAGKILSILALLFALLITVCTALSVTSVVMLSQSRSSAAEQARETEVQMEEIVRRLEEMEGRVLAADNGKVETEVEAGAIAEGYYLRAIDGDVCLFDAEGELLEKQTVSLLLLPAQDRAALEHGIAIATAEELSDLLQDLDLSMAVSR